MRTQQYRDDKYLEAFFGQDFIDELRTLDSEFLKTGNKLLSLHSMDTTSLSAALFLFALAKNSTRKEILDDFQRQVECDLPQAEMEFLQAAGPTEHHERRMTLLALNARFVSLRGFFNGDVAGDDTLNPIQREFIRLAQIFKSRLVTELELNQRMMERSMIEDRLGDYLAELRKAAAKEQSAENVLASLTGTLRKDQQDVLTGVAQIDSQARAAELALNPIRDKTTEVTAAIATSPKSMFRMLPPQLEHIRKIAGEKHFRASDVQRFETFVNAFQARLLGPDGEIRATPSAKYLIDLNREFDDIMQNIWSVVDNSDPDKQQFLKIMALSAHRPNTVVLGLPIDSGVVTVQLNESGKAQFIRDANGWPKFQRWLTSQTQDAHVLFERSRQILTQSIGYAANSPQMLQLDAAETELKKIDPSNSVQAFNNYSSLCAALIQLRDLAKSVRESFSQPSAVLSGVAKSLSLQDPDIPRAYGEWVTVRSQLLYLPKSPGGVAPNDLVTQINASFLQSITDNLRFTNAKRDAVTSRRPLDQKKFLDMLTDDIEDKYIELLEGTRAHTANIDAYIKAPRDCLGRRLQYAILRASLSFRPEGKPVQGRAAGTDRNDQHPREQSLFRKGRTSSDHGVRFAQARYRDQ